MFYRFNLFIVALTLGFSACSSKPEHDKGAHHEFTTDIRSNGSKRFILTMAYPTTKRADDQKKGKRSGKKREGGGRSGKGEKGQSEQNRDSKERAKQPQNEYISDQEKREAIIALLNKKMVDTSYCRAGYIELNFSQLPEKTEIKGECVESASTQDKQRWD